MGLYFKVDDVCNVFTDLPEGLVRNVIQPRLNKLNKYTTHDEGFSEEDTVFYCKPCPFCGSKDAPKCLKDNEIREDGNDFNYAVVCDIDDGGCGATGRYQLNRSGAVKYWNNRV